MSESYYYRPIAQGDRARVAGAISLAGSRIWFTHVERLSRSAGGEIIPAAEVPAGVLRNLTQPRADICGLSLDQPRLMGVLNATPDSFSDGGVYDGFGAALAGGRRLICDGADILDIGGESTRPGADYIEIEEEISRTAPVIDALRKGGATCPISIDTRKAAVADAALAAGGSLVNDVSALSFDPDMQAVISDAVAPVCLMHASGDPKTMQDNPKYDDVLLDVYDYLAKRVAASVAAGIPLSHIIVDPGIGFGKTLDHNLALICGLSLFHGLGCAVLLGVSRKRFIGTIGGAEQADRRAPGSIALGLEAVRQGVQMLRVHDIMETRQALALWQASR